MNRPGALTRLMGYPPMSIVLLLVSGFLLFDWWFVGHAQWLLALIAAGVTLRTLGSIGSMLRYKAWLRQWQAMGEFDDDAPPQVKRRGWKLPALAVLMLLTVPLANVPQVHRIVAGYFEGLQYRDQALAVWQSVCLFAGLYLFLYVVFVLVRGTWRGMSRTARGIKTRRQEKAEAAPVALLLGRASSSPSRAAAEKNLQDYCLKLMGKS